MTLQEMLNAEKDGSVTEHYAIVAAVEKANREWTDDDTRRYGYEVRDHLKRFASEIPRIYNEASY